MIIFVFHLIYGLPEGFLRNVPVVRTGYVDFLPSVALLAPAGIMSVLRCGRQGSKMGATLLRCAGVLLGCGSKNSPMGEQNFSHGRARFLPWESKISPMGEQNFSRGRNFRLISPDGVCIRLAGCTHCGRQIFLRRSLYI
jgi:hypothetical protein